MQLLNNLFFTNARNGVQSIILHLKEFQSEIIVGVCVFLLVYVIIAHIMRDRSNFPPGPMGLPVVGYLPFLTEDLHLDFIKLGKKYGDVFSLRLGSKNILVLNGAEAIKEALNKPEFLGRPPDSPLEFVLPLSAFFAHDFHLWKEQRRFVVQSMKDLGLGKTKIEEDIQDEINQFVNVLKSHNGQPMDVNLPLSPSVSNNICALVFGKRYDYEDPNRRLLDERLDEAAESFSQNSSVMFFPWLKFIPFYEKFLSIDKTSNAVEEIRALLKKEVDIHENTLDPRNIRDFIDRYLVEIESKTAKDPNSTFNHKILMSNIVDLFSAGSETVRTSILWFFYTMAAFPDVQKKIQHEIMEVLGSERNPEYLDLKNMPYTHAVIMELMRWKTIVPVNILRYTVADATVSGYDIPQGTIVLANFWNIHHDPRYWDEPDVFKPERFMSKDGKSVVKSSNYMPFSLGRRVCPGESMANMEMFLYYTSILQKFDIAFPDGIKPTFDAKLSGVYRLHPFRIRFIPKK